MSRKAFHFHFNRVNMQRGNPNVWTVHQSGKCIQGQTISCMVPVVSSFKPKGRQPRATFRGKGHVRKIDDVIVID